MDQTKMIDALANEPSGNADGGLAAAANGAKFTLDDYERLIAGGSDGVAVW